MNRQEANKLILDKLVAYLDKHPGMRFGQAVVNLGILRMVPSEREHEFYAIDPFYEEPVETLKHMRDG